MNPIKAAQNIGQYRLTFKANKEDKKLILMTLLVNIIRVKHYPIYMKILLIKMP